MLTTLDWKGWVFKNYDMMNRSASPPWNKHNLNKTILGSNSVINLTTHNITCKQIFQYHLGSIDTVAFQRTSREGLHSITQLQLAPSIEHQISAMFSILVRCFDTPPLLSTRLVGCCSSVFKNYLKRAQAALCFDFIMTFFWDTLYFWKHRSGYLPQVVILVPYNDDHGVFRWWSLYQYGHLGDTRTNTMTKW